MLEVDDLHALLRQEPHPAGRVVSRRRRRDREPARPQRRRPLDRRQDDHGPRAAGRLHPLSSGDANRRSASRTRSRAGASATCPRIATIFPTLTVRENLLLGMKSARRHRAAGRSTTCSTLFPMLRERIDAPGGVLSGGEQQMLTICRTLMGDPDLIMVDEPTEGLAPMAGRARARACSRRSPRAASRSC